MSTPFVECRAEGGCSYGVEGQPIVYAVYGPGFACKAPFHSWHRGTLTWIGVTLGTRCPFHECQYLHDLGEPNELPAPLPGGSGEGESIEQSELRARYLAQGW